MKLSVLGAIVALGAAAGLAGCADDYAYGPRGAYANIDYGVFYDSYYGPFMGGYWGPTGYFYYPYGATGAYRRDTGAHFRRNPAPGFNQARGHAPAAVSRGRRR